MRILFLTPNFPPEVNAAASRTHEHCRRWAEAGHKVTVIAPAPNWPAGKLYEGHRNAWRSESTIDGVRVIRVWTLLAPNKGLFRRLLSFLIFMFRAVWEAIRERHVDLVVATSPQFFCGQAGMWVRWLTGLPLLLEIRDLWPESIVSVGAMRPSLAIRCIEWLERTMYRTANHIVTVGEGYREKLLQRGVSAEKISVVPNGVDLSRWTPRPACQEFRRRWGGEGKLVCTYVGTVGMAHGLEVVIRAASKLRNSGRQDIAFWIVGDGAERQQLERQAGQLGLDNVHFAGQVSKTEVAEVIAASDACLVHLRSTELFATVIPSKIFEIMAMETPIVMGVRGEALEVVETARAGVAMEPENEASLLAALETLRAGADRYQQGREYTADHYSRDEFARQMLRKMADLAETELEIDDESDAPYSQHTLLERSGV